MSERLLAVYQLRIGSRAFRWRCCRPAPRRPIMSTPALRYAPCCAADIPDDPWKTRCKSESIRNTRPMRDFLHDIGVDHVTLPSCLPRRGGRVAEGAPLLREYGLIPHRGFESLPLRQPTDGLAIPHLRFPGRYRSSSKILNGIDPPSDSRQAADPTRRWGSDPNDVASEDRP